MAVVIRLQRTGRTKQAYFRVVAIEKRRGATGKPLEVVGHYNPRATKIKEKVTFKQERLEHWLKVGAKPSETVASLIKRSQAKKAQAQPKAA